MKPVELWQTILRDMGQEDLVRRRPWPGLDPEFYLSRYPDLDRRISPMVHFREHGRAEGRLGNRYKELRRAFPQLDSRLERVVHHPLIEAELKAGSPGVHEVLFELMLLGDPVDRKVSDFSIRHYLNSYPDIAAGNVVPAEHFLRFGIVEGRRTLGALRRNQHRGRQKFDPKRPTCLVCVHEMSRTGAPLVGLNLARNAADTHNVVIAATRRGTLLDEFRSLACEVVIIEDPVNDLTYLDSPALDAISVAVLNSIETVNFVPALVARGIPFASYLHEYVEYTFPAWKPTLMALLSDLLVFSSTQVRRSWLPVFADIGFDMDRDSMILPQEEIEIRSIGLKAQTQARARLSDLIGIDCADRRIVYGAGHIQPRKGTDLFAMTAQIARRLDPETIFVWIGDGASHEDMAFGIWLDKHLREIGANRSDSNLFCLPAGPYYHDICRAADVLYLSSRLDPLPNVVFDALKSGCRVLAFQNASGFDDPVYTRHDQIGMVPYGDLGAAAEALVAVPRKQPRRRMETPAESEAAPPPLFDTILTGLKARMRAQRLFVIGPGSYDVPAFFSSGDADRGNRRREREKIWSYGRSFIWRDRTEAELRIAASDNWIHQGMQVRPLQDLPPMDPAGISCTVPPFSIHIHAYYLDDLETELLAHAGYRKAQRIVATTNSEEKAEILAKIAAKTGIALEPRLCQNRGRDILPFLNLLREEGRPDDIWCHVHQKKSAGSASTGDVWRQFLMRILLGDTERITSALTEIAAPGVGLVTAFDPYIVGWSANYRLLPELAPRLPGPLPPHPLLFPVGNMFWVRGAVVEAMNRIFPPDYPWPSEPLPNDGTVFHLIERLWPAAARMAELDAVFLEKKDLRRA